jgi:hypothetical protein
VTRNAVERVAPVAGGSIRRSRRWEPRRVLGRRATRQEARAALADHGRLIIAPAASASCSAWATPHPSTWALTLGCCSGWAGVMLAPSVNLVQSAFPRSDRARSRICRGASRTVAAAPSAAEREPRAGQPRFCGVVVGRPARSPGLTVRTLHWSLCRPSFLLSRYGGPLGAHPATRGAPLAGRSVDATSLVVDVTSRPLGLVPGQRVDDRGVQRHDQQ